MSLEVWPRRARHGPRRTRPYLASASVFDFLQVEASHQERGVPMKPSAPVIKRPLVRPMTTSWALDSPIAYWSCRNTICDDAAENRTID